MQIVNETPFPHYVQQEQVAELVQLKEQKCQTSSSRSEKNVAWSTVLVCKITTCFACIKQHDTKSELDERAVMMLALI